MRLAGRTHPREVWGSELRNVTRVRQTPLCGVRQAPHCKMNCSILRRMLEDGLIQNKKTQSKHKHVKMLSPLLDLSICPQVPSRPQASDLLKWRPAASALLSRWSARRARFDCENGQQCLFCSHSLPAHWLRKPFSVSHNPLWLLSDPSQTGIRFRGCQRSEDCAPTLF